MSVLSQDLLYALRHWRKHHSTAITSVITLAIGIAVSTTIFSVFNAVVLHPLPYADSNRLMWLTNYLPKLKDHIVGTLDFIAWRDQNHTLDEIAAFNDGDFNLTSTNSAERIHYEAVTSSFFDVVGVQPAIGRPFRPQENTPVAAPVVIISSALWHRRFGGARSAIGSKIELDYRPYEIVGITAPNFVFPASGSSPDVLMPLGVPR
jgi:putative ABC transport system permease protein